MDFCTYSKNAVLLYGQDKNAFKYITKKANWKVAFITIYVLSLISNIISTLLYGNKDVGILTSLLGVIVGGFVVMALSIAIWYGVLHLFFKLFGAKGKYKDTVTMALSIGVLPALVSIPLSLVPLQDDILLAISSIILLVIGVWAFVLSIFLYAKLHKISPLKSFFALILPIIILVILGALIGFFVVSLLGL